MTFENVFVSFFSAVSLAHSLTVINSLKSLFSARTRCLPAFRPLQHLTYYCKDATNAHHRNVKSETEQTVLN